MSQVTNDVIDLRKETVRQMKNELGLRGQKAQVGLVLDCSGSAESMFSDGTIQTLVERILPLGLNFDDNGEVDVFLFDDSAKKIKTPVSLSNLTGYVPNTVRKQCGWGSTRYAPIINLIVETYVGQESLVGASIKKAESFISGLFGSKKEVAAPTPEAKALSIPVYIIFVTDGENDWSDKDEARKALINASNYGIFFQFVGIGSARFQFLEELDTMEGRAVDNANFFSAVQINNVTDLELYNKLMAEFPSWIDKAKQKNLLT